MEGGQRASPLISKRLVPAAILAWAAGWTVLRLGRPLWFDEASTALVLLPQPVSSILRDYSGPFNHILYTCLLRLWTNLVGRGSAEILLRLPSLAFGLGSVAVLLFGLRRPRGPLTEPQSWLAAALLAGSPAFLLFSWQIRGYCLSMLLSAATLAFYFRLGRRGAGWGYAACGAAAIAVMPTNLLLPGTLGLASLAEAARRRKGLALALAWAASPLAGFLAYSAVLGSVLGQAGFQTWQVSAGQIPRLLREAAPAFYFAALLLPFAAAGLFSKEEAPLGRGFVALVFAAPFALVFLSRTAPYSRNLLVMLPIWCAAFAACAEPGLRAVFPKSQPARLAAAACLALAVSSAAAESLALAPDSERKTQGLARAYYDTDAFRPDLAIAYVKDRKLAGANAAVADDGDLLSLIYYARTTGGGPVYYVGHLSGKDYRKLRDRGEVLVIARDAAGAAAILRGLGEAGAPAPLRSFGFFSVFGTPLTRAAGSPR